MSAGNAKQKVLEVIEKLPADATLEDAIERLVPRTSLEKVDVTHFPDDERQCLQPAQ